jgi:hypothetical protein
MKKINYTALKEKLMAASHSKFADDAAYILSADLDRILSRSEQKEGRDKIADEVIAHIKAHPKNANAYAEEILGHKKVWYQGEYYDKLGGHGALSGSSENFEAEYKKAMQLYRREKKTGELGKSTGYIGISGSGDKFAILFVDKAYVDSIAENFFKDKVAYEAWMKVAKSVLETGKPEKGNFGETMAKGGSVHNFSRDRMFLSQDKWQQRYKPLRAGKHKKRNYDSDMDKFKDGGEIIKTKTFPAVGVVPAVTYTLEKLSGEDGKTLYRVLAKNEFSTSPIGQSATEAEADAIYNERIALHDKPVERVEPEKTAVTKKASMVIIAKKPCDHVEYKANITDLAKRIVHGEGTKFDVANNNLEPLHVVDTPEGEEYKAPAGGYVTYADENGKEYFWTKDKAPEFEEVFGVNFDEVLGVEKLAKGGEVSGDDECWCFPLLYF